MLVKWFFVYIRETRAYLYKLYRLIFTPSAYARAIALEDERVFRKSLNFFLASASSYIAIGSLLQKLDGDHVILQNFSQDFVAFARLMGSLLFWSMLNFLAICLLLRRMLSFNNFFHCWLHVSIINMAFHLYLIIATSVLAPPMSDIAQAVFAELPKSEPIVEMCLTDKEHTMCRMAGGAIDFGISYAKVVHDYGLGGSTQQAQMYSNTPTGMQIYIGLVLAALVPCLIWGVYVQSAVIGAALRVSRTGVAIAHITAVILVLAAYYAFPPLITALSGAGYSAQWLETKQFFGL